MCVQEGKKGKFPILLENIYIDDVNIKTQYYSLLRLLIFPYEMLIFPSFFLKSKGAGAGGAVGFHDRFL